MALNKKLIQQFVKATKDDTKDTKKETIVYGSITSYDAETKTCYVRLDGADKDIPITQFTSVVNSNERVTVMIKNHTAIITGNLQTPSVGSDYVDTSANLLNNKIESIVPADISFIDELWKEYFNK